MLEYIKKLLSTIIEPIKLTGNRGFSEKIAKSLTRKSFVIYIISALVTLVILLFYYL